MPEEIKTDDAPQTAVLEQEANKEFTPPADEFDEFLTSMRSQIAKEVVQRNVNFQRVRANYQMYKGMIGRPFPDIPYEGSADIRYRNGMRAIRQTRPDFTSVILEAPRTTRITPFKAKYNAFATDLEGFYETMYRGTMEDCYPDAVDVGYSKAGIDGRTVAKIVWRTEVRLMSEDRPRAVFVDAMTQAQKMKYAKVLGPILLAQQQAQGSQQPPQQGQQPQQQPAQPAKLTPAQIESAELDDDDMKQVIRDVMGWEEGKEGIAERVDEILDQLDDVDNQTNEVNVEKVIYNQPWIAIKNYEDIVVPTDTGRIRNARWICDKMRLSDDELRAKSVENGGNYQNVEKILETYDSAPLDTEQRQIDSSHRSAEGLGEVKERKDMLNVWELYCWVKRSWIKKYNKKTGKKHDYMVKAVITFCPQMGDERKESEPLTVFRAMELPYNHGMWPYEDYFYNYTEDRFYEPEGIIGLGWPLEMEFNTAASMALNRSTMAINPPGFYMEDCGFEPSTMRQFGQMHPIDNADYIAAQGKVAMFMDYPNLATIPDYDSQKANAQLNNLIGISDPSGLTGQGTAPTAEQVQMHSAPAQKVQRYEIDNWLRFWGRIFKHVHLLCKQYLFLDNPEGSIEYRSAEKGEAKHLTPAHFEPEYIIAAGGDPQSVGGAVLQDQKLVWAVQFVTQNPAIAPFVDFYDAVNMVMSKLLPYNVSQALVPPREKAEQMNKMFLQMAAEAKAKLDSGKRPPRQQKNVALQNAGANLKPAV